MKKRNWKGRFAGVLTIALSMVMAVSVYARVFPDTSGHWAQSYIDKWSNAGLVVGYEDGTFRPEANIKKAEFASVLNQYFKYTAAAPNTFSDVSSGAWYANIIQKLVAAGVISPDSSNRIYPESYLTRGELLVMIAKAFGIAPVAGNTTFLDDASISAGLKPYVKALQVKGLIAGYAVTGGYEIRVGNLLTRAEMLTVWDKASGGSVTPTVTPVPSSPDGWVAPLTPGRSSSGGGLAPAPIPDSEYEAEVQVYATMADGYDFTLIMVEITDAKGLKVVSDEFKVIAGGKEYALESQADGTYRGFLDDIFTADQIQVVLD
ncbi:MAG: S-layer homology domain-containing protein [Clostridiales bacterium]|jgi:hypothetical protein|nr:S-layer homology domain-containing protein [Clostridiales bacterium]